MGLFGPFTRKESFRLLAFRHLPQFEWRWRVNAMKTLEYRLSLFSRSPIQNPNPKIPSQNKNLWSPRVPISTHNGEHAASPLSWERGDRSLPLQEAAGNGEAQRNRREPRHDALQRLSKYLQFQKSHQDHERSLKDQVRVSKFAVLFWWNWLIWVRDFLL